MATLDQLRAKLNGEIAVAAADDTTDTIFPKTVRDQAIADGYAELWRAGVWKLVTQDLTAVSGTYTYALSSIRRLERMERVDADGIYIEKLNGWVEEDGAGGNRLRLNAPVSSDTIRVRGWTAYKSVFSSGTDTDDLPAEHQRIPLLKAKAILWRARLATFARYEARGARAPEMSMTVEQFIAIIAAAEREFEEESSRLAHLRTRTSQTRSR